MKILLLSLVAFVAISQPAFSKNKSFKIFGNFVKNKKILQQNHFQKVQKRIFTNEEFSKKNIIETNKTKDLLNSGSQEHKNPSQENKNDQNMTICQQGPNGAVGC